MELTRSLTKLVERTSYEDFPPKTLAYAKLLGLTCIGSALAGATETPGKIVTEYVRAQAAAGEAGVIASGFLTTLDNAAFANNALWHATELEGNSYPECVSIYNLFPPMLAVAEKYSLSGRQVLEACIIGHEVQARLGLMVNPNPNAPQSAKFMNIGVMGIMAIAAGTAKLLQFSAEQTVNAISLAASQACGIVKQTGSMAHFVESGFTARSGMLAALLAKAGMSGRPEILETKGGLCDIMTGGASYDPDTTLSQWGQPFRVEEQGEKLYPCCYLMQHFIETTLELKKEHTLLPNDIASIHVETNAAHAGICRFEEPSTPEEAKFSINHGVAVSLLDKTVSLSSFSINRVNDPDVANFRRKVKVTVHSEWEAGTLAQPHPITITMRNGQQLRRDAHIFHGHPPNFMTSEELIEKFRSYASLVMSPGQMDACQDFILGLDELPNVSALTKLLTNPRK